MREVEVTSYVDAADVLDALSDEELIEELKGRQKGGGYNDNQSRWHLLADDLDLQLALQRGDAETVFRLVSEALSIHPQKQGAA